MQSRRVFFSSTRFLFFNNTHRWKLDAVTHMQHTHTGPNTIRWKIQRRCRHSTVLLSQQLRPLPTLGCCFSRCWCSIDPVSRSFLEIFLRTPRNSRCAQTLSTPVSSSFGPASQRGDEGKKKKRMEAPAPAPAAAALAIIIPLFWHFLYIVLRIDYCSLSLYIRWIVPFSRWYRGKVLRYTSSFFLLVIIICSVFGCCCCSCLCRYYYSLWSPAADTPHRC